MALWSVATGELLWDVDAHVDFHHALAFSPDGRMVVVGGSENELQLWRLWPHVGKAQTLSAHEDNVNDISFHPAGHQLVSASADGTLKVWDVVEGRLLATFLVLPTTDGTVSEEWITFTPTGHYVGSAEVDGYVNWQVEEKLLPAEAFREVFHRPDLVAEALQPE
jgi:WD40 repeat protein